MSRVNLVVGLLLALSCVARAMENVRSALEEKRVDRGEYSAARKVHNQPQNKAMLQNAVLVRGAHVDKGKVSKMQVKKNGLALSKNNIEEREHPRRRKRKMDRTMMALLMAYKLKFIALLPTLLGSLLLLKGTALLAGFFFALFAAVLGLKIH